MKRLLALALLLPAFAHAGNLIVSWDWPTQYMDGTPIAAGELTNARIQLGTCTTVSPAVFGTMTRERLVAFPTATFTFTAVPNGTYCARGFAQAGTEESDSSNVIAIKITNRPKQIILR
jgi:hypothetical protein